MISFKSASHSRRPAPTAPATTWVIATSFVLLFLLFAAPQPQARANTQHDPKATPRDAAGLAIQRGIAFLTETQADDGSWSPQPGPAITALILRVILERPNPAATQPDINKAVAYILSKRKPDGSIHDGILANYNTAIVLSALAKLREKQPGNPDLDRIIKDGQDFLRSLQWAGQKDSNGNVIDKKHPHYGGSGYGRHGRPDISNTQFMLQALHDTGLSTEDPAYQRALVFISRLQGVEQNDMYADTITPDGGFIYATSANKENIGIPISYADPDQVDEAKAGRPVSGLRTYGSVTYAGFKSYLYADLARDDPRVAAAHDWIQKNYTLTRNPGMPIDDKTHFHKQGLYYYYMTMARALDAWGQETLATPDGEKNWKSDLIAELVKNQKEDGSWTNTHPRWMENNPDLVTAYALIALIHATQ